MNNLSTITNPHERLKQSVFGQIHKELRSWSNLSLRRSYVSKGHGGQRRAFKVKFMGEGVNDYGGPYRAVFETIIDELQSDNAISARKISDKCLLPLCIPCPNRSAGVGANQDKYVLSPSSGSPLSQELMQFFGKMIGLAIRHGLTLGFTQSILLWRSMVKLPVSRSHLEAVDSLLAKQLRDVEELGLELEADSAAYKPDYQPEAWHELFFTTYLSDGTRQQLIPRGDEIPVTLGNWRDYIAAVERVRLLEGEDMLKVLRDGMSVVVPTELFPLFTAVELEQLVGGRSTIDIALLQQCTEYENGLTQDCELVRNFWEVLDEMTPDETTMFLRFVWARSRMPASLSELSMNFKLQLSSQGRDTSNPNSSPDDFLPSAQTCFFSLSIPNYSSKQVLKDKLMYAIENSPTMDADVRLHSAEGWADA